MPIYTSQPEHQAGETCFACSLSRDKGGRLVLVKRKTNASTSYSLICSRFPDCKNKVSPRNTKENSKNNTKRIKFMNRKFNKVLS